MKSRGKESYRRPGIITQITAFHQHLYQFPSPDHKIHVWRVKFFFCFVLFFIYNCEITFFVREQEKVNLNRLIGLVGWVFVDCSWDLGSMPGRVIPKALKVVLDTFLLNTQQYKVRIKGKVEQFRERSCALHYTSV